jgi:CTP synthase
MCIEFARHVLELADANSTEFEGNTPHPIIDLMPEQRAIDVLGGTMRLGLYPCDLVPGTIASRAYSLDTVQERHRHRFEFNNTYRAAFEDAGMCFSGQSPDRLLLEIAELRDHPFMLGSQFHPEFGSRPNAPHPLLLAFVESVIHYAENAEA